MRKEYCRRIILILKVELNAKIRHKTKIVIGYSDIAVSFLNYSYNILNGTLKELATLKIKQEIITAFTIHHQNQIKKIIFMTSIMQD